MSIDFYDMEQHATNLITFCTTHLSQMLDSYSGKKLSIEPYLSIDTPINAKSTVLSGQYKITLNVGAYVAINNYYEDCLLGANKSYYQKITGENEYNSELAEYYFKLMRDISLLTLIYHECGHIYSGHLDYIAASRPTTDGSASLNADNVSELTLTPIRHQAMEWNADDFSATRVIETFFGPYYWDEFNIPNQLSFSQLFWTIANATLVSYCMLGSKKETTDLMQSVHLPAKFRALAFIKTAEKKLQKWCGYDGITPTIINDAIAIAKTTAEVYDINYRSILSNEEKAYYDLAEYELLVRLPVALFSFQHLQSITPELMIHTAVRLFDAMTAEERILLQKKLEAEGKHFPIDELRYLANHIAD